jgi:CRISPR-associated protein Csd1
LLAGEVMRAVLTGARYPQSLLAAAIIRLRAGDPKMSDGKSGGIGWHAAVIRAVLMRDHRLKFYKEKVPMSLDRDHRTPGYLLGRLFAMHEVAQRAALGRVNASIRDRYFGAASATPASVFPLIVRGGQNHLAKVRKEKPGWATLIERELDGIYSNLGATLPRSLSLQQQGEFAIGYYHQRSAKLKSDKGEEISLADHDASAGEEGDEA